MSQRSTPVAARGRFTWLLPTRFGTLGGPYCRIFVWAAVVGAILVTTQSEGAEPAFGESFDGPDTIWQLLDTDAPARILQHERSSGGARDDAGSERIVAAAPAGQSIMFICPAARMAVLPELEVRLWVKASRPDVQLAARVTLPRSPQPHDQSATTVTIRGPNYNRAGHWQQLVLTDVPKLLAAQIRVMRSAPNSKIDPREAFLDAIVLIVPGQPNGVEVATDELQMDGIVLPGDDNIEQAQYTEAGPPNASESPPTVGPVRLQGGLLLVNDRPFLPRVVPWQGEPLSFLAERGFNVVELPTAPNDEQIADAQRHGLWFMCGTPRPDALSQDGLGRIDDRILAWRLDDEAIEIDPGYARRWAELVRERDVVSGRPVLIAPQGDWSASSNAADILIARHPRVAPIAGPDFDRWLERQPQRARPGTPYWASIATQFDGAVGRQSAALSDAQLPPPSVEAAHIESLLRIAGARGARGFVFESNSSLRAMDIETRGRAAALELINRRLQLMEPWLAAGKVIGRIPSSHATSSGIVMHVDRARLLIPIAEPHSEKARVNSRSASRPNEQELVFLVPGIPESSRAFVLSPVVLRPLPMQRVAGGTRVTLPSSRDAYVLITEDPQVIQGLRRRIARDGPAIVRVQRDLIVQRAELVADTTRRLTQLGYNADALTRAIGSENLQLSQIDAQLAAGRVEEASELINAANSALNDACAEQRRSVGTPAAFDSNPLALSFGQVAANAAFDRSLETLRDGENLLYSGDFEDLGQMTQFGWRHYQQLTPGVDSRVELSPTNTRHGDYCLELRVASDSANQAETSPFSALVWIETPPMPVTKGQLIEITGWVRIDEPITADGDGLQIVDSLGGPELSLAIRQTSGWQPFRMIRAAAEPSELRLTFALAGVGAARLDAVMVRTFQPPIARRLPPTRRSHESDDANVAEQTVPLLVAPQSR